ncbi:MAG: insulinase family protein [Anaerolineae bacterium]|nr:insulinase family protein [Anaerolineae bacterium]
MTEPLAMTAFLPPLLDFTLANGLRVILAEDHSAPLVATNVLYHVGAANDPPARSGFAHLLEHLMSTAFSHVKAGEFDRLLEAAGAENNACTTLDYTAYQMIAPANQLPLLLWLEAERMGFPKITRSAFKTQRRVVIEELKETVTNSPYGASDERFDSLAFQGYPPYERPVIGTVQNLTAARLDELLDFQARYYRPNNATLVIAGDLDPGLTQALVRAYFGDLPAGPAVTPVLAYYPLPARFPATRTDPTHGCQVGAEEVWIDPLVELPRYAATVVGPRRGTAAYYAFDLLADILGGGDSSRTERQIVRPGLAAAVSVSTSNYLGASSLDIVAYAHAGQPVEPVGQALRAEFDRVIAAGVTEAELARVKKKILVDTLASLGNSREELAEHLQEAALFFGDPGAIAAELAIYNAVTLADIQQAARTYLYERPMNVLLTLPAGRARHYPYPGRFVEPVTPPASPVDIQAEGQTLPESTIDRTVPPAALPVGVKFNPSFERFKLANGLNVILVEQHRLPLLDLKLYLTGSNPALPAEKQGLAELVAGLLTRGTSRYSADEIAERMETAGGGVDTAAALEWLMVSVTGLSTDKDLAFDLLAEMVCRPAFPPAELNTLKEQLLSFLAHAAVEPDYLADRQFCRVAFGRHPYSLSPRPEMLQQLTRQDVLEFYQAVARPNNALLTIAGDMTTDEARLLAERFLADWRPGETPDFLKYPPAASGDTAVIYLVDRPESSQATLQMGNLALHARSPDRYALEVANAVLGGTFASRLNVKLREEMGVTYGVESSFAQPSDIGTFRVCTNVDPDRVAETITEILGELHRIRTQAVTAGELVAARGYLAGNFLRELETPADLAEALAERYLTGVPLEELQRYLEHLEQVTEGDTLTAAARYIQADQAVIVVVGDAARLKPQLERELNRVVVVLRER